MLLNFSYGSNMLSRRIRERVPEARPVGTGTLRGYSLRWHKVGKDGSGKCDIAIAENPESLVFGVVYELPLAQKSALDDAEGLGHGYTEIRLDVETRDGIVTAWAYRALITDASVLPFTWYRALVVAGAREHSLPAQYVGGLQAARAVPDHDDARAAMNFALAGVRR